MVSAATACGVKRFHLHARLRGRPDAGFDVVAIGQWRQRDAGV
jgi:hypothetical protein